MKLGTDNRVRLYRRDVLKREARLVKVRGRLLAAGAKVSNEDTQKVMAEFP
jgi:hypothetical protein